MVAVDGTKCCSTCGEERPLITGFSPDRRNRDGRQSQCRACRAVYFRMWGQIPSVKKRNAQRSRERLRRPEVREHMRVYRSLYRKNNRSKINAIQRRYLARKRAAV